MNLAEAVAKRTKNLLFINNITQYRLCKEACLSRTGVHDMFHGKSKDVNISTIYAIANFFNMSLEEFFADPVFEPENLEF